MKLLGAKIASRKFMKQNRIPIVDGVEEAITSYSVLQDIADQLGYPLILKASSGGGGKGMRVVYNKLDLKEAYDSCCREAESYFADGSIFCERYLERPRHIEVQILGDKYGNIIHLYERECSIQRRHQKLIEEAPSCFLSSEKREELGLLSLKIAKLISYEGVGTIEFITSDGSEFFFMEMNTRIQVEHPVTEMITGIDLVKEQILSAQGFPLDIKQKDVIIRGYSIEARINAENPEQDFLPSVGKIKELNFPQHPFIRIDSHVYEGYEVPSYFDSLLAKIISWGRNREESIKRLILSLCELDISGVHVNKEFLLRVIKHDIFLKGCHNTHFLEEEKTSLSSPLSHKIDQISSQMLASIATVHSNRSSLYSPKKRLIDSQWYQERRDIKFEKRWK